MDQLNYNHLYYFWVIATEGGVTAACKKLRLAQPTLSVQLKLFEESIGKNLFERRNRKLVLNDDGRLVFDYADSILKKGADLIKAIRDSSIKDFVTVTVGVVDTLPRKNVHNYLKIPITHGTYNLSLSLGKLNDLLEQLKNRQLDFILSNHPVPPDAKGFVVHTIEKVPIIFVASPSLKNLRRKFPGSLSGQNLFLPSYQTETRTQIDAYLKKNNITARIKGEIQDHELLRVIAASGDGVCAVARTAVSDLIKAKELYVIGDNLDVFKTFYIITRETFEEQATVVEILKRLKD